MLPVVLYNGDTPWKPATEMHDLIAAPSPLLVPYQPSQRHFVLDQRRAQAEDFKLHELTWTVAQLEQSSTAADLARIGPTTLLAGTGQVELRRTSCTGCGRWRGRQSAAARHRCRPKT